MPDDIVTRLRQPGRNGGVCYCDDIVYGPCADCKERNEAADEIELLRSALALACGELSGYGPHTNSSPDHLMQELLEEARRAR